MLRRTALDSSQSKWENLWQLVHSGILPLPQRGATHSAILPILKSYSQELKGNVQSNILRHIKSIMQNTALQTYVAMAVMSIVIKIHYYRLHAMSSHLSISIHLSGMMHCHPVPIIYCHFTRIQTKCATCCEARITLRTMRIASCQPHLLLACRVCD